MTFVIFSILKNHLDIPLEFAQFQSFQGKTKTFTNHDREGISPQH